MIRKRQFSSSGQSEFQQFAALDHTFRSTKTSWITGGNHRVLGVTSPVCFSAIPRAASFGLFDQSWLTRIACRPVEAIGR